MHKVFYAVGGRLLFMLLVLAVAAGAGLAIILLLGTGQMVTRELAALLPAADTQPLTARAADTMPVVTGRAAVAVHLLAYGAQPSFTPRGDSIIFQRNLGGVSELFAADVVTTDSRCLTVGGQVPAELRGRHKGNALAHPAGRVIIFTAENRFGDHGPGTLPENGYNHDIWAMTSDGKMFWRLAATAGQQAVAGLVLSPDGRRLLWTRQTGPPRAEVPGGEMGFWELQMADLQVWPQGARLGAVRTMTPLGPGYYGTGSFLPDNRSFIFSASDSGVSAYGADLYRYDAPRRRAEKLTATPLVLDRNARLAPDGEVLAWTAGRRNAAGDWQAEIYLMRLHGAALLQLTRFNEPGYDEYLREPATVSAPAWHPRGDALVAGYSYRRGILGRQQRMFMLPLAALPGDVIPARPRQSP